MVIDRSSLIQQLTQNRRFREEEDRRRAAEEANKRFDFVSLIPSLIATVATGGTAAPLLFQKALGEGVRSASATAGREISAESVPSLLQGIEKFTPEKIPEFLRTPRELRPPTKVERHKEAADLGLIPSGLSESGVIEYGKGAIQKGETPYERARRENIEERTRQLKGTANQPPKLTTQENNILGSINVIQKNVGELYKVMDEIPSETGPKGRISGFIQAGRSAAGLAPKVNQFQSLRQTVSSKLARALGEVGVLTNQDIQRVLAALPDITDTTEERQLKKDTFTTLLKQTKQAMFDTARERQQFTLMQEPSDLSFEDFQQQLAEQLQ